MRTFDDIARQRALKKYLTSRVGVLFYGADHTGRIIVRKFPSAKARRRYVAILYAFKNWVAQRPAIDAVVAVETPFEVGIDFVARAHRIYTSTAELLDEDSDVELPAAFFSHRQLIESALGGGGDGRPAVLERVVQNSLLASAGKTCFDFSNEKFIVVEPTILPIDIASWRD